MIEQLFHEVESLFQDIQSHLQRLHSCIAFDSENGNNEAFHQLEAIIESKFTELSDFISKIELSISKQSNSNPNKAMYKGHLEQIRYEIRHNRGNFDGLKLKHQSKINAYNQREALMATRFKPNDSSNKDFNINLNGILQDQEINGKHARSLLSSNAQVDVLLDAGRTVLQGLRHQRLSLKQIQTKMLGVLETLGLSNTLMRLIERRTLQDKFIMYGGMAVTTILVFFILIYLR